MLVRTGRWKQERIGDSYEGARSMRTCKFRTTRYPRLEPPASADPDDGVRYAPVQLRHYVVKGSVEEYRPYVKNCKGHTCTPGEKRLPRGLWVLLCHAFVEREN